MKNTMNEEDTILEARVNDAFNDASQYKEKFVGFLTPHEAVVAKRCAQKISKNACYDGCSYEFFGGYDCAERVFLGVFPPYFEKNHDEYPLVAVRFKWRFANLSHRDFLGVLLASGIDKTKIGDIVVSQNECTVFLEKKVSSYVLTNITKVGSAGVNPEITNGADVVKEENFKEIKTTIASPRLDCVVAALTGLSRSAATELIKKELVSVNFEIAGDSTKNVDDSSTVSIRGHGRFAVVNCGPETRKGRLRFFAKKYL